MGGLGELLGESPGIAALREQVVRLLRRQAEGARRLAPILILGETGTGKGVLAAALHRAGPRATGPFVDVNCAAIPETLLEAELFGFERGAFTDARQAKAGLFQAAHGGTLFLDEVGLLPEGLQAKLLKVLEERSVRRLGSTRSEPVDAWLLAATSEDLEGAVRARRFRQDLYHRLAVVTVQLPPLRERGDDVLLLAEHFLTRACADYRLAPKTLGPDARAALRAYPWPGNVRELANVMERVALLADGSTVTPELLRLPPGRRREGRGASPADERRAMMEADADAERAELLEALRATRWNVSQAAARLRIPRNTLRYRMEKLGLAEGAGASRRGVDPAAVPTSATVAGETAPAAPAPGRPPSPEGGVMPERARPPGSPELRPPVMVRWELRRVALLRVRLVSEQPEPNVSDASRAMAVVLDKVRSFGGHVDELSTTGLVAVFGLDPGDDAVRLAAYAAMAVAKVSTRARREEPARPAVRAAIHTERLPVGRLDDAPEIDADAKRAAWAVLDALTGGAESGIVAVSPRAATFLARRFELAPLASIEGVTGEACRLVGPAETGRERTGFVGRSAELALLRDRFERAEAGQGQVVSILGEPGIGKSRLLRELRRQVGDRATWAEGQALSIGRMMPFHPLIDLLRRLFQIDEGDPETAIVEKIERSVLSLAGHLPLTRTFLRYLLAVDPGDAAVLTMDPNVRRTRIFEAVHTLLLRIAERTPLVMVCEDVHWMDQATDEYLALMIQGLAANRIVLILTARPGYAPSFGDRTYCTRMPLTALSTPDSLEMARGLLAAADVPPVLRTFITGKAEGNPLFVEEIVRSLHEVGAVRREGERVVLTRGLDEIAVPDTVQEVILARMDRLEEGPRQVLQMASALGNDVPLGLLRAVADLPEATLSDGLGQLRAAEFLYEARVLPEPEYRFKHALTHDVAYDSLAPARRRALHARIVEMIERTGADRLDEHIDRLAHHAVRGEVWEKAVRYLRLAGARAFEQSANREAVVCFEEALEGLGRLPETDETIRQAIDLRFDLRNALFPLTELDRISESLREGERLARLLNDRRRLGWVAAYTSSHLWMIGQSAEMSTFARTLRETAEALDDIPLEVAAHYYVGAAHGATGNYGLAAQVCRKSLQRLDGELGRQRFGLAVFPAVMARSQLAWCLAEQGELAEGIGLGEEGLRIAEALDHPFSAVSASAFLAYLYRVKADWSRCEDLLERALALSREWGVTLWSPFLTGALGYVCAQSGRVQQGLALLERAQADYDATGLGLFHSLTVAHLGEACLRARRLEESLTWSERALALSRQRGERGYEAWTLRLLGEIALHLDPPDVAAASERYRMAMDLAGQLGMRPLVAHCHLGLGTLYRRTGADAHAEMHLTEAAAMYRAMDMAFWLARTETAAA